MKIFTFLISLIMSTSVLAEDISQIKFELLLAQRGDLSAQLRVANAYENGVDVKKNIKEALNWYIKAANQSHAPSQYKVGYFYENALGVAKNVDTAMSWYKKAKANGSDEASQRLDKTAYEKTKKVKLAQRAALQAKLEKEEKARLVIENKKAKAAAKTAAKKQAKKQAKEKRIAKQRAQAKKQAKKQATKQAKKQEAKKAKKVLTKAVAKKVAPKAAPIVVALKKKAKAVRIPKMLKHVLKNKWKNQHGAADYLPSASTSCLESGNNELTCFSSEKSRKIKGSTVTYTTKSTLFGFKSNGSFKVVYNYNGVAISGAKSNAADMYGLSLKEGWQEPALAIKCLASDRKNLTCFRGSKQVKFNL